MTPTNHARCALVTGAAGFIGKDVVSRLLKRGWRVKALVRRPPPFPLLPGDENLQVVRGDMRDPPSLLAAMRDVAVVVHLAAATADDPDSDDVNVGGARRLIEACRATGCRRLINVSTQATKIRRQGMYGRTKSEADRVFHGSELQVTTLLPSVVYGAELRGVFGTVVKVVQRLPVVPVLGDGGWRLAPIWVGDVSEAIVACIENDDTISKRYDLGGPDLISFDTFIDKISAELGLKRRRLHIPFGLGLLVAKLLARLMRRPPITVSNVLGSNQDTNFDGGPARQDLGFNPLDVATGLKRVLGNVTPAHAPTAPVGDAELAAEGVLIARYLVGKAPPADLIARYIAANRRLLREVADGASEPEVRFVRRHPAALPLIDAASGLLTRPSLVRKKVYIMAAVLEATPVYADFFLKPPPPIPLLLLGLGWQGLRSLLKVAIGLPLLMWVRRRG